MRERDRPKAGAPVRAADDEGRVLAPLLALASRSLPPGLSWSARFGTLEDMVSHILYVAMEGGQCFRGQICESPSSGAICECLGVVVTHESLTTELTSSPVSQIATVASPVSDAAS